MRMGEAKTDNIRIAVHMIRVRKMTKPSLKVSESQIFMEDSFLVICQQDNTGTQAVKQLFEGYF